MIVFSKKYRPLTAKLLFKLVLLGSVMVIAVPQLIEVVSYRLGVLSPIITHYTSAVVIVLGALTYICAVIGLFITLAETKP